MYAKATWHSNGSDNYKALHTRYALFVQRIGCKDANLATEVQFLYGAPAFLWWLWCNGNTPRCERGDEGSTPSTHPTSSYCGLPRWCACLISTLAKGFVSPGRNVVVASWVPICYTEPRRKTQMPYKDKEQQRAFQKQWEDKKRQHNRILVEKAKSGGCSRCGESDPVCLDFHHTNPESKSFAVSKHWNWRTEESLLHEIAKCVVLCRNCHAKVHAYSMPL